MPALRRLTALLVLALAPVPAFAGDGVPATVGVTSEGNDGSRFSKYGSTVVPISRRDCRSHSPVGVIDGRDLEAPVNAIVVLAEEVPAR
jgi:hypothetical protein